MSYNDGNSATAGDQLHANVPAVTYSNPPVIETSVGVEFSPISGWNMNHFGLYQSLIREQYPGFETMAPLSLRPGVTFQINPAVPKVRAFYVDQTGTRLLQVQDDLFFTNWRKASDSTEYPRYAELRTTFLEYWEGFKKFVHDNNIAVGAVVGYQLLYVNIVDTQSGDDGLGLTDVLVNWHNVDATVAREPSNVSLSVAYT
jgi:uncharacterized protein (TIGR04255 family)